MTSLLQVSDTIGSVTASFLEPDEPLAVMTLAHGAGAGMDHTFMVALAEALAAEKIATLRFNFPFMENKKGRPDVPAVAHKTIEVAVRRVRETHPSLPVLLAGKSFGGRMSSQYLAAHPEEDVKGIVFYGFPLHPVKKPSTDRADHLRSVNKPMLFLQGTKDALAEWSLIEQVTSALPKATLSKLGGADHAFKAGKQNLVPVLAALTASWLRTIGN